MPNLNTETRTTSRIDAPIDRTTRLRASVLDHVAEAVFTLSSDGKIIDVNQAAIELVEMRREDLLTKPFSGFLLAATESDFDESLRFLKKSRRDEWAACWQLKDSKTIDVEILAKKIEFEDDHYFAATVRDVSSKRELERELRLVADSVPAFIGFVGADRRYRFVNKVYQEYFGVPTSQIIGMKVEDLNGTGIYNDYAHYIDSALAGQSCRFEFTADNGDERQYLIQYKPRFEENGDVVGYYVIATDITATRRAEAGLIQSEQRLKKAISQFEDLAELAHHDRVTNLGEMASAIAHELNQPLMVISGLATVLESHTSELDCSAKIRSLTDTIATQAVKAGDIVHRMRQFVSGQRPHRESADLNQVVNVALQLLEPQLRDLRVNAEVRQSNVPNLWVDPIQIQQVLINLVLNAAEAMQINDSQKRQVEISTGQVGDEIRITVTDNGPGVDASNHKKLFDAFFSTKPGGMGMGLAISRSLVESHQGKLFLDREYQNGSSFVMVLPSKLQQG